MPRHFDILIQRAQLRGHSQTIDIGTQNGKIIALEKQLEGEAGLTIDAGGNLVTESFVNPHLHLCKVYTRQMMDDEALTGYHAEGMGKAMTTIELAARVKEKYAEEWIIKNVRRALAQATLYGNTHIRAFADVDGKARLEGSEVARKGYLLVLGQRLATEYKHGVPVHGPLNLARFLCAKGGA